MLDHLHIPITQSVAFGDADNDMEFLQMAGLGVAMLNAKPLVQDIADQVTEWTNDDDGVIRTLQAMEKEGLLLA
jgi:hydroxymethylpyrimidine pyrophosphatase-like HAD family hydrolase